MIRRDTDRPTEAAKPAFTKPDFDPKNVYVGSLSLSGRDQFPANIALIRGNLILNHTSQIQLPDTLYVEGNTTLKGTGLVTLPKEFTTDGFFKIEGPQAKLVLSETLNVGQDFTIKAPQSFDPEAPQIVMPTKLFNVVGACIWPAQREPLIMPEILNAGSLDMAQSTIGRFPRTMRVDGLCNMFHVAFVGRNSAPMQSADVTIKKLDVRAAGVSIVAAAKTRWQVQNLECDR